MESIVERFPAFWEGAFTLWLSGGWAMMGIAGIAVAIFSLGIHVALKLRAKGVPEEVWRRWIDRPEERRGPIGALLDFVTGAPSLGDRALFFQQLRTIEAAPFERELRMVKILVSAAPLLGLLGTVTGMLATFAALSSGSGGEKTMGLVAQGISEALITTETGLVVALPGLFLQVHLVRKLERYKAFLAHLETVCTQTVYGGLRREERDRIDQAARQRIAQVLYRGARQTAAAPGVERIAVPRSRARARELSRPESGHAHGQALGHAGRAPLPTLNDPRGGSELMADG